MSWLTYVLKTPAAQKRMDKQEYKLLNQQLAKAVQDVSEKRSEISYLSQGGTETILVSRACINYALGTSEQDGKTSDKIPNLTQLYCPDFYATGNGCGCRNLRCAYVEKNEAYHRACANADNLRVQKELFWRVKFANVK